MTTSSSPDREPVTADDTDLALYALGALDDTELRTVETLLATDARAAAVEGRLRRAAGSVAAIADGIDTAPPLDLRDRVLAAARAKRSPTPVDPVDVEATPPAELRRIEAERFVELVRSLRGEEWDVLVDPPEFAGWTVRDLVVHVAAVEAFAAASLGITAPAAPETQASNDERTRHAIERHRSLPVAATIDELEQFLDAVDDEIDWSDDLDRTVRWWDSDLTVAQMLIVRSFELWTHAADIARAIGRPEPVPAAPSLRTMSDLATALTPTMCAASGTLGSATGATWVRFVLTGPGGATHDVSLDPRRAALVGPDPVATLTLDIVDYCRAVGNRIDPGGVPHHRTGDAVIAAAVIASLPALATL